MIGSHSLFAALLASASLTACALDEDALSEEESNLSSASWSTVGSGLVAGFSTAPVMVVLDGVQYSVFTYQEGGGISPSHDLYYCAGTCVTPTRIPNQESMNRPSLAVFNDHIYMVHQGDSDGTAVWFSRFDQSSNTWTANTKLPFTTYGGSPALAAFNGSLVMVGSRQVGGTYPLWTATMNTSEVWSSAQPVANEESVSSPSMAVLGSTLYLAHRWGQTAEIVMQQQAAGGAWSAVQHIPAGPNGTNLQGNDVQLAVTNGYLHLIHHQFNDANDYWWTYNRGCDAFAPEITVPNFSHITQSTLASTGPGLLLNALNDSGLFPYTINHLTYAYFAAPRAPITAPSCGIHGIGR